MNRQNRHDQIIRENRYGDLIDLETSPLVLIEIIRNYRNAFDENDNGGKGGVSPGISTVAVAGQDSPPTPPSPPEPERFEGEEVLKSLLKLQKQVDTLDKKLDRLAPPSARFF